jgi:lipopolysaccharide heptosyltransferase I
MSGDKYPWTVWGDGENRKILIVRLGSLGDIVHALPAMRLLNQRLPRSEIHWLAEPPYAELLQHVVGIQKVRLADTKAWRKKPLALGPIFDTVKNLRRERYDAVFDFQGLVKSAVLSRLTGSGCVAGFPQPLLREKLSHHFYNCPVEIEKGKRHQISINLDLVDPPRHGETDGAEVLLHFPDTVEAYLDKQFERLKIMNPVLLNPGAGWATKRWPVERFVKLAELIENELNFPVLFTYGPGEEALIQQAREASPTIVRSFPSSILELAALCKRARIMVAGDTGPMHLAVAMRTPVVALIGPGYPWRTGPFNPEDKIVQHDRPCPHPYQRKCDDHFCMDLPVEKVYLAICQRLSC